MLITVSLWFAAARAWTLLLVAIACSVGLSRLSLWMRCPAGVVVGLRFGVAAVACVVALLSTRLRRRRSARVSSAAL
jgi:hypothetical protein